MVDNSRGSVDFTKRIRLEEDEDLEAVLGGERSPFLILF